MATITKEELGKPVWWVVGSEDLRSGSFKDALSDKADCLDLPEVPRVVDHVIHERQWLGIGGNWFTADTYSSFVEAEAAVEDDERIVSRRIWEVRAGKDLICRCDSEADAELERLNYLHKAEIDRDIVLFKSEDHARIYHAIVTGKLYGDEEICEAIDEIVLSQAIIW